jgi:hypothetical protein
MADGLETINRVQDNPTEVLLWLPRPINSVNPLGILHLRIRQLVCQLVA